MSTVAETKGMDARVRIVTKMGRDRLRELHRHSAGVSDAEIAKRLEKPCSRACELPTGGHRARSRNPETVTSASRECTLRHLSAFRRNCNSAFRCAAPL